MEAWWEGLSALNKVFAVSALAFSVAFLVQMIMMSFGLDAHDHASFPDSCFHENDGRLLRSARNDM